MLTRIDLRGRRHDDPLPLLPRAALDVGAAVEQVRPVVEAVRDRGAAAVREATARFDGVALTDLRVPAAALQQALAGLDPTVRAALVEAARRVRAVSRATGQRAGFLATSSPRAAPQRSTPCPARAKGRPAARR